jgi:iron complex outermembrane recepter protein
MKVILPLCASVALALVFTTSAAAQTASLEARVTDPDRATIAGAPVVLTHVPTSAQQTALTRSDGTVQFAGLAPGEYRLEIVAPGFQVHVQTVTLDTGARVVEARLEIAPITQDITVEGVATVPTIGRVSIPLRDQPLTVNTLTASFLEAYAINDLVTALKYVPNVTAYSQYGVYQYFTFRGFSDSVQLVDGIRNEGNRVNTQLANVERIEVLKGPAGVLYGNDAVGATVNLVLKKPSPEPVYDFSATAGRWDTYRGSLGAGGRVGGSNAVFYRFDIGGDRSASFRHDGSRRFNVTPSVAWRISNGSRLEARYSFDRNRMSGDSGIPLVPILGEFTLDPSRTAVGDPLSRAVQGDGTDVIPLVPRDRRYNTPQDFALGTDQNIRVSWSQAIGRSFGFRNTVGYRHFDDEYWVAEFLDVTPPSQVNRGFLYFKHHRRPVTNQAEFNGRTQLGVTHDFLVGWDYQHYSNYTHRRAAANFNTTPMDLFEPVETHVSVNLGDFPVTRVDHFRNRTNAIFFQDTITVVPKLKIVAGGRYDQIRRRNHNNPVVNGVETEGPITRGESDKFTHRVGLVYQPTAALDLYAQNSSSFRPNFTIQADGTPLEPEYGEQFEVGQRLRLLQERLHLMTAVFQIEKRNVTRSLGGGFFEQIGKLRSRGFEAELAGQVAPRWSLGIGYGFTRAEFRDYLTNAGVDLSGNTPRRAPRHTVSLSTSYAFENGLSVSAGTQVVSHQFINDANTVGFNGYELVNLGASYTRGRIEYGLNLTNVTDRQYWESSLGNRQLYPGQPFNVLATVRVRTSQPRGSAP